MRWLAGSARVLGRVEGSPARVAAAFGIGVFLAFFPVLANTTLGLNSVDHNLIALFDLYKASRWQVLWNLKLPAALPQAWPRREGQRRCRVELLPSVAVLLRQGRRAPPIVSDRSASQGLPVLPPASAALPARQAPPPHRP